MLVRDIIHNHFVELVCTNHRSPDTIIIGRQWYFKLWKEVLEDPLIIDNSRTLTTFLGMKLILVNSNIIELSYSNPELIIYSDYHGKIETIYEQENELLEENQDVQLVFNF